MATSDSAQHAQGMRAPDLAAAQGFTIWMDVSDFVAHMSHHVMFSGIQRVVSKIIQFVDRAARDDVVAVLLRPVPTQTHAAGLYRLSTRALADLIDDVESGHASRSGLDARIADMLAHEDRVQPRLGDVVFLPGAFWLHRSCDYLMQLRSQGVHVSVTIHDIIQIRNEEYCVPGSYAKFLASFVDIVTIADFLIAESDFVVRDIHDFMAERLDFSVPVHAVPLATELPATQTLRGTVSPDIRKIAAAPYVLCVGPIERRKNQLYLISVWEELRRNATVKPPNLIFVGGVGVQGVEVLEYARSRGYLEDWLFVRKGVSDVELQYLYEHCLLSAFVSFAEGWGLPIGESLARGKPCVASNVASMPEVGGTAARYVDPFDVHDGVRVFQDILADPAGLAAWEAEIRRSYVVKTWRSFGEELFQAIAALRQRPVRRFLCVLEPGLAYSGGDKDLERLGRAGKPLMSFRMARTSGWHPMEPWGCWASDRVAEICFATSLPPGQSLRIYLELRVPPLAQPVAVEIAQAGAAAQSFPVAARSALVVGRCMTGADGIVRFNLTFSGVFPSQWDGDVHYLGLVRLGFCPEADLSMRMALVESFAMSGLGRSGSGMGAPGEVVDAADLALAHRIFMGGPPSAGLAKSNARLVLDPVHQFWLMQARAAARRGLWPLAERRYARLIRRGTATPAIWVQYAHVLKEQQHWEAAVGAYRIAAAVRPDDIDLRRHLHYAIAQCA